MVVFLRHDSKVRGRIAVIVIIAWLIVPIAGALAVIGGWYDFASLKDELLPMWHQYTTWIVTLVIGYYFSPPTPQQ